MALSSRGNALLEEPQIGYISKVISTVWGNEWDASTRPDGYVDMSVAQNRLCLDLIRPQIESCGDVTGFDEDMLLYGAPHGGFELRGVLMETLGRHVFKRTEGLTVDNCVLTSGACGGINMLVECICDPGDGVLLATPYYAGFAIDIERRTGSKIIPVHTSSSNSFELTTDLLEGAFLEAARSGIIPKCFILCNPDNPKGTVIEPTKVLELVDWAEQKGIHVIVDEIYALSTFREEGEDKTAASFRSIVDLRQQQQSSPSLGTNVHFVWSFSKDFCNSGVRTGVIVSENMCLLNALTKLCEFGQVSRPTQRLLYRLLTDKGWVDAFIVENQRRLRERHIDMCHLLDTVAPTPIKRLTATATFFVWIDLSEYLAEKTPEGEDALWNEMLDECRVNFVPGTAACSCAEPGWFRVCFTSVTKEAMTHALTRLGKWLGERSVSTK